MDTYTEYEKIMPSEKLPDFLFHYFHLYEKIPWVKNTPEELFYQSLQFTVKKYNKHKLLLGFLDKFFLKLYFIKNFFNIRKNKKKVLFRPFKYTHLILGVKKYHHVGLLVHGRDRLVAIKNFMGYVATSDLDQYLLSYLKEKNIIYLYQLIKKIEDKLRIVKPDYIVLWNDIIAIERAIALVSKKLGIVTLEVHHGVYDEVFPMETGKIADYVLVWGQYFKDLYVQKYKRNPENIYILGYPYSQKKNHSVKKKDDHYNVCYLGQNFEFYNKELLNFKIETVRKIHEICGRLGLNFVYRPHPGDNRALMEKKMNGVAFTLPKEILEKTLAKSDILISFSSTALIEAAMKSKIALQLMNYPMKSDNWETLGGCTKSFKTTEELESYLKKIASAKNLDAFKTEFNNDYVETRRNPIDRFLEIINDIEKKKNNI